MNVNTNMLLFNSNVSNTETLSIIMYFTFSEFGQERSEPLADQSADNIFKKIEGLVKK